MSSVTGSVLLSLVGRKTRSQREVREVTCLGMSRLQGVCSLNIILDQIISYQLLASLAEMVPLFSPQLVTFEGTVGTFAALVTVFNWLQDAVRFSYLRREKKIGRFSPWKLFPYLICFPLLLAYGAWLGWIYFDLPLTPVEGVIIGIFEVVMGVVATIATLADWATAILRR